VNLFHAQRRCGNFVPKKFPQKIKGIVFLKEPFLTKKVFSQTLFPKTAAASREKPLVFNWDDVWEAHGCADAGAEQA
jgi:hypothetical protein